MSRPVVSSHTERVYELLPEAVRAPDPTYDWPLLRYLSLVGDTLGAVEVLLARLGPTRPDGTARSLPELLDGATADEAWLTWLAQIVGADIAGLRGQALRDAVTLAPTGRRAGTKTAIADAARSALTGGRYARVYDHTVDVLGDGDEWDVLLVTRVGETPDVPAVLLAVEAKRAVPAGVLLRHKAYSATYAQTRAANTAGTYAGRRTRFPLYRDAADYLPEGA